MKKEEFARIRRRLGKTQVQMSHLLGCSQRTVESFEQGLRKIPVHVERHLLFLLLNFLNHKKKMKPCWIQKECPMEMRRLCPAWEFQLGHLCWFVNGTICQGEVQENWQQKIKICRQCKVFLSLIPDYYE